MANADPLVSIVLSVKNGMPHVRDAVESVRMQSYGNYELVIQDGASTDGTREYLELLSGFPALSVQSQPDSGQGQGFNRALQRCRGEIIGSVDSDNRLQPDAVAVAVRTLAAHPTAASIYGSCRVIDEAGAFVHMFLPAEFDLLGLLDGSVVPPFASSFFSRAVCGERLHVDDFPFVPDFAFWLRLADLEILRIPDVLADVRAGPQSSTYQPSSYDQQTHYKILAATRYLRGPQREHVIDQLIRRAKAGIYLWAVDSMQVIGGPQERVDEFFALALDGDLRSERFRAIVTRARPRLQTIDPAMGQRLLMCGVEFLEKGQPHDALVYLELLERSGYAAAELPALLVESRWQAVHLQQEVDRRDEMIRELHAHYQEEIAKRDQLLSETYDRLQADIMLRDRLLEVERGRFYSRLRTRWRAAVGKARTDG